MRIFEQTIIPIYPIGKAFAFVKMGNRAEADSAKSALRGCKIKGQPRPIRIKFANQAPKFTSTKSGIFTQQKSDDDIPAVSGAPHRQVTFHEQSNTQDLKMVQY